ncbi:hypothetical protein N9561_00145 [bacterium]|nr:hypothetical protein [bacterium]
MTEVEEGELEQAHFQLWSKARAEHIEEIVELARTRMASLKTSHTARLMLLEEQCDTAIDSRIRRMRESQIEAAMRDYERRMDDLKKVAKQGDIVAEAVVFGLLIVEEENEPGI